MSALHRIELCVVLIPLKRCWLHSGGEGETVLAHIICTIFENKESSGAVSLCSLCKGFGQSAMPPISEMLGTSRLVVL